MPCSAHFAQQRARILFNNESAPSGNWKLAPLTIESSELDKLTEYNSDWEAFDPINIGNFTIVPYTAADPDASEPIAEVLPYAYATNAPFYFTNSEDDNVVVKTLAVINTEGGTTYLYFWKAIAEQVIPKNDRLVVDTLKFELSELGF